MLKDVAISSASGGCLAPERDGSRCILDTKTFECPVVIGAIPDPSQEGSRTKYWPCRA